MGCLAERKERLFLQVLLARELAIDPVSLIEKILAAMMKTKLPPSTPMKMLADAQSGKFF